MKSHLPYWLGCCLLISHCQPLSWSRIARDMGCPSQAHTLCYPNPICPSQLYFLFLILPCQAWILCHLSINIPFFMLFNYYLNELQVVIYVLLLYFNFTMPDIVLAQTVDHWLILGIFHYNGICGDVSFVIPI